MPHEDKTSLVIRTLDGRTVSGEKTRIVLSIGAPYAEGKGFRCPFRITGLDYEYTPPDIGGWDPLQAMLLGISFCASLLDDFVIRGGRLYYPDTDTEYDLSDFVINFRVPDAKP